jgi:hypothetical protein
MPQGGHNTKILNLPHAKQTKTSIVQIKNNDNLCCPRAVVVALTYPAWLNLLKNGVDISTKSRWSKCRRRRF